MKDVSSREPMGLEQYGVRPFLLPLPFRERAGVRVILRRYGVSVI